MDSPRPSSETSTLAEQDQPLLLSEFTISSPNSHNPSPNASTKPRIPNHIFRIRIAICILNFLAIPIPVFGAPDTLMPLLPMTYFTTFLIFPATIILLNNSHAGKKSGRVKGSRDIELGSRRSAILVEDPITGEERWMLEPKKEVKTMGRKHILGIDIYCMVVFLVSIILSLVFGMDSPRTLGGVVAVRGVTMLLISSVMVVGERDEEKSVGDGEELESEVLPGFCSGTGTG